MYKRKIEAVLEAWKNEPKRKPLVVKGCTAMRQDQLGETVCVCKL